MVGREKVQKRGREETTNDKMVLLFCTIQQCCGYSVESTGHKYTVVVCPQPSQKLSIF